MAVVSVKDDFPVRPGYGTKEKAVTLWANYFNLTSMAKDLVLFRYHVGVSPEAKNRKLKRIFELSLEQPQLAGAVTDYKSLVVIHTRVEDAVVSLPYRSEFERQ